MRRESASSQMNTQTRINSCSKSIPENDVSFRRQLKRASSFANVCPGIYPGWTAAKKVRVLVIFLKKMPDTCIFLRQKQTNEDAQFSALNKIQRLFQLNSLFLVPVCLGISKECFLSSMLNASISDAECPPDCQYTKYQYQTVTMSMNEDAICESIAERNYQQVIHSNYKNQSKVD